MGSRKGGKSFHIMAAANSNFKTSQEFRLVFGYCQFSASSQITGNKTLIKKHGEVATRYDQAQRLKDWCYFFYDYPGNNIKTRNYPYCKLCHFDKKNIYL